MTENEPDMFEDPLGDLDEDEEDAAEDLVNEVGPATNRPATPSAPPVRPDIPAPPSPSEPASPELQRGETPSAPTANVDTAPTPQEDWDGPEEEIEKKNGEEHSNFTIEQAHKKGTLREGVYYRTGGFLSALGLVAYQLTQKQIDRMSGDGAYRDKVFKEGP